MLPDYRLELTRDTADQVVYEESADYSDFFICLAIGVSLLAVGLVGMHMGIPDLSRRKLFGTCLFGGFCFCCMSIPYVVKSRIIFSRDQQTIVVRRALFGFSWTHVYRVDDVEDIFESSGARERGKVLGLELTNGRTQKLTLWARRASLSAEEAHLKEALNRFRKYSAQQTGRLHHPVTEEEWWGHTHDNARADLRRHLKRTLYSLIGFIAAAAAVVPFSAGFPLHKYWRSVGAVFLFATLVLWTVLVVQAAFSFISWRYLKDLQKIDTESSASPD